MGSWDNKEFRQKEKKGTKTSEICLWVIQCIVEVPTHTFFVAVSAVVSEVHLIALQCFTPPTHHPRPPSPCFLATVCTERQPEVTFCGCIGMYQMWVLSCIHKYSGAPWRQSGWNYFLLTVTWMSRLIPYPWGILMQYNTTWLPSVKVTAHGMCELAK